MSLVFENANGFQYFIIAANGSGALLREMSNGGYVIARGLDWDNKCWRNGFYYGRSIEAFEAAAKAFTEGR